MQELMDENIIEARRGKELNKGALSQDDIRGNTFIMLAAGQETSVGVLRFILLELANNPVSQRSLHGAIDETCGDGDPSLWDYENLINPKMASMLGACAVSAHRNPRCWPGRPSLINDGKDDINDWVPERWYRNSQESTARSTKSGCQPRDEEFGSAATSTLLFRLEGDSFIPFSDGPRSCLGRRISQGEIIATLAVLFKDHSLELAIDDWASDEQMDREARREVYAKAQSSSRKKIRGATSVLTLKIRDGHVPVRLVKRGREKFWCQVVLIGLHHFVQGTVLTSVFISQAVVHNGICQNTKFGIVNKVDCGRYCHRIGLNGKLPTRSSFKIRGWLKKNEVIFGAREPRPGVHFSY
ncbi:cytochrome P450 [Fusarium oxysporum f. sp. phaseoli]